MNKDSTLFELFDGMALNVCQAIDSPIKISIAAVFYEFRKRLALSLEQYGHKINVLCRDLGREREETLSIIKECKKNHSEHETAWVLDLIIDEIESREI